MSTIRSCSHWEKMPLEDGKRQEDEIKIKSEEHLPLWEQIVLFSWKKKKKRKLSFLLESPKDILHAWYEISTCKLQSGEWESRPINKFGHARHSGHFFLVSQRESKPSIGLHLR